jgi:hypothetical protein
MKSEFAIEQIQRLQRGRGHAAFGGDEAAIWTIERAEYAVLFHAHFEGIDHPPRFGGAELLLRVIMVNVFAIHIMEKKAGAAPAAVEVAADGENAIANGFGFQSARRKTPE